MLFSVLGVAIVLVATAKYGAGLTPDSTGYVGAARNLAGGKGVTEFDGTPFLQSPLYSILLAGVKFLSGKDPLAAVSILNAIIFGGIIFVAGLLFTRYLPESNFLVITGLIFITLSPALTGIMVMAWSEPLFIFLTLLFIFFLEKYLCNKNKNLFLLFSVAAMLACLTRYIGIAIVVTGLMVLLFFNSESLRKRVKDVFLFLCISFTLPVVWIIRNYFVSGTITGPRADSAIPVFQNLVATVKTIIGWYLPAGAAKLNLVALTTAAALIILVFLLRRKVGSASLVLGIKKMKLILIFSFIYPVFMLIIASNTAIDVLNDRLLSPLFIPLAMLFFVCIDGLKNILSRRFSLPLFSLIAGMLILCWLVFFPVRGAIYTMAHKYKEGAGGYNSISWKESPMLLYLSSFTFNENDIIFSNAPDALYLLCNKNSKIIPAKTAYNSEEKINDLSQLKVYWPPTDKTVYLINFNKINRSFLYNIKELESIAGFQLVKSFNDGEIYRISPHSH